MPTFLSDDTRKFLTGGVSILLASRNGQYLPSIARAKGCAIVDLPVPRLRVFVSALQAADLVTDVRASGMIAATFSVPATHRSLQFKGSDAKVKAIDDAERPLLEAYVQGFIAAIGPLGFSEEFTRAFLAAADDEVAIEFTPTDAFEQTPGPSAGARLP